MKLHTLIITIILLALFQVSFFYSDNGLMSLNIIIVAAWFVYLYHKQKDALYIGFFAGLLVDLLRLSNIGVTSFSILLPMLIYIFLEAIFQFKGTILSYFLILVMIILSNLIYFSLMLLLHGINIEDALLIQNLIFSAGINWVIIVVLSFIKSLFFNQSEGISFAK